MDRSRSSAASLRRSCNSSGNRIAVVVLLGHNYNLVVTAV